VDWRAAGFVAGAAGRLGVLQNCWVCSPEGCLQGAQGCLAEAQRTLGFITSPRWGEGSCWDSLRDGRRRAVPAIETIALRGGCAGNRDDGGAVGSRTSTSRRTRTNRRGGGGSSNRDDCATGATGCAGNRDDCGAVGSRTSSSRRTRTRTNRRGGGRFQQSGRLRYGGSGLRG
jgi:hypothetical protein